MTAYNFDAFGNPVERPLNGKPRPTAADAAHDANSNHALDTGETLLSESAYTYNADDTRASETDTDQAGHTTTTNWTYDGESRVAKETLNGFDDAGNAVAYTDSFQYDMASNRTLLTHTDQTPGGTPGSDGPSSVTTFKYDGNDRLLSETTDSVDNSKDTFTTYAYGSGNATSDQTASTTYQGLTSGGTVTKQTSYSYDAVGHMTGATITDSSGTTSVSYVYDTASFRVEQTVGPTRTVYLVDPANPTGYTQVLEEGVDANNNHKLDAAEVQKAYTLGMKVLAQATATQVLHLLSDAHGNTKAVLNVAAGPVVAAILQRYAYTAYGSDLGLISPLAAVRYAGQMIDPLTGLSFNRARWYNPADGRFFQSDPFAGNGTDPISFHKYLYGNGNPINLFDPNGHEGLADTLVTASINTLIAGLRIGLPIVRVAQPIISGLTLISFAANPQAAQDFIATGGNPAELVQGLLDVPGLLAADAKELLVFGRTLSDDAKALGLESRQLQGAINYASGTIFQEEEQASLGVLEANGVRFAAQTSRGSINVVPDLPVGKRFALISKMSSTSQERHSLRGSQTLLKGKGCHSIW